MSSLDPIFKILSITHSRYNPGTSPFALAVCVIENNLVEALALLVVFENKKFFLHIVKKTNSKYLSDLSIKDVRSFLKLKRKKCLLYEK